MALQATAMAHSPRSLGDAIPGSFPERRTHAVARLILCDHGQSGHAYLLHDFLAYTFLVRIHGFGKRVRTPLQDGHGMCADDGVDWFIFWHRECSSVVS